MKYNERTLNHLIREWRGKVYKKRDKESLFFASLEWQEIKEAVYLRDSSACLRCGAKRNLTVHHIIPRNEKGTHELFNLMTLCYTCHDDIELDKTLRTKDAIMNSYEIESTEKDVENVVDKDDWRSWVYGGQRNPNT